MDNRRSKKYHGNPLSSIHDESSEPCFSCFSFALALCTAPIVKLRSLDTSQQHESKKGCTKRVAQFNHIIERSGSQLSEPLHNNPKKVEMESNSMGRKRQHIALKRAAAQKPSHKKERSASRRHFSVNRSPPAS